MTFGVLATEIHELGQAGNGAAISGSFCVSQGSYERAGCMSTAYVVISMKGSRCLFIFILYGGVAKWLNAADCKSAPSGFGGSNPSPSTIVYYVLMKCMKHVGNCEICICGCGGIGRRTRLRIWRLWRGGSSPFTRTIYNGNLKRYVYGGCGEVVNASDCGSDTRGFDSHQSPLLMITLLAYNGGIAKW